jgi:hypothetical protein
MINMISVENVAVNQEAMDSDFTVEHYRELLRLAMGSYKIARYHEIPWGSRFLLWRHDIDLSPNRSLVLAKEEYQVGLKSTYFINPHSEFYNVAELGQHKIVQEILSMGHDLGLHLDLGFHDVKFEQNLIDIVECESDFLCRLFGIKPVAFSFHNPVAAHLTFEAEQYGGLVNCYSRRFKTEVAYCSDSNGYWRFRRLHDVLSQAVDPCLQVLTHPGWWQDVSMPPRQRVFRSAYGRAVATMKTYDAALDQHGRLNHSGAAALLILKSLEPKQFELCDYLWNQGHFKSLFVELCCFHKEQINRLCKVYLHREWGIPVREVCAFFRNDVLHIDSLKLFDNLFEQKWLEVSCVQEEEYKGWLNIFNQLIRGQIVIDPSEFKSGCIYILQLIKNMSEWGRQQQLSYDGLRYLDSIESPPYQVVDEGWDVELKTKINQSHLQYRWEALKAQFVDSNNSMYGGSSF